MPGTEWYAWVRSIKVAGGWLGGWGILCSYVRAWSSQCVGHCRCMESAAGYLPGKNDLYQHDDTDKLCDKCHYIIAFILFSPQYGDTALHKASSNGHPEVVKLLLQSHAYMNVKNDVSTESPH